MEACDLSAWAGLDPVYLDGIAGAMNLGTNVMICYFRWEPTLQPSGLIVPQRIPALAVVRPLCSVRRDGSVAKLVAGQKAPRGMPIEAVH